VLDEATAALDPESQDRLMQLVSKQPSETTRISVGHGPELESYHNRKVVLERRRGGTRLVSDIRLAPKFGLRESLLRWLPWSRTKKQMSVPTKELCAHK
jgi:vitamin B12/bleomycin/antimicrobial peptide transport system ATP-binding/permease protein